MAPGTTFQWRHGDQSGTGVVLQVDAERSVLKLATRIGDDERTHTFDLDRSGGFFGIGANDSRVRYTYAYDPPGGMLGDKVRNRAAIFAAARGPRCLHVSRRTRMPQERTKRQAI